MLELLLLLLLRKVTLLDVLDAVTHLHLLLLRHLVVHLRTGLLLVHGLARLASSAHLHLVVLAHDLHQLLLLLLPHLGRSAAGVAKLLRACTLLPTSASAASGLVALVTLLQEGSHQIGVVLQNADSFLLLKQRRRLNTSSFYLQFPNKQHMSLITAVS